MLNFALCVTESKCRYYLLKIGTNIVNQNKMKIDQEDFNRKAEHIIETIVKPQVKRYEKKILKEKTIAIIGFISAFALLMTLGALFAGWVFKGAF